MLKKRTIPMETIWFVKLVISLLSIQPDSSFIIFIPRSGKGLISTSFQTWKFRLQASTISSSLSFRVLLFPPNRERITLESKIPFCGTSPSPKFANL